MSNGDDGNVGAAVCQQAEEVCSTMQAGLAALKDSSDASCPTPTRQQVAAAVQLARIEVAKLGLVFNQGGVSGGGGGGGGGGGVSGGGGSGGGSAPSDAEAAALLKGIQEAVCTLCMVYTGIAVGGGGGGPTLRASLHQTATAVVEACVALVRGAVVIGAREAQLMMLSGFCLEMLAAAEKAPLDSRTAIGRAITQVLKQLADAVKELEEELQQAEEEADAEDAAGAGQEAVQNGAGAAGAGAGSDADSDAGFGMFASEPFSPQQLRVARRVHGLLAAVVGAAKAVVKVLLAEREGLSPEAVEGWESMLYHVKGLGPLCDDLSAAAYPPQDVQELASAAEALATTCELLVDECPSPSATGAGEEQQQGGGQAGAGPAEPNAALGGALEAVQAAQAELAAELAKAAELEGGAAGEGEAEHS